MKIERYAAIDIGSNAVRVLISNVVVSPGTQPKYMKSSLVRVPTVSYTHLTLPTKA